MSVNKAEPMTEGGERAREWKRGKRSSASSSIRRNSQGWENWEAKDMKTRRGRESKRGEKARTHIISVKASFVGCRCWSSLPSPSVSLCLLRSLRHCWIHNLLPYSLSTTLTLFLSSSMVDYTTPLFIQSMCVEESERERRGERARASKREGESAGREGVRKCG